MILVHKKLPLLPQFANASLRLVCDELLPVCTGGTNSKPATLLQGHPGNMAVVLFAMGFYGCGCERRCCAALRCAVLCCNVGDPSYPCGCPQKAACAREKSTRGSGHSLKRDVNFGIEPLSAAADLGWRIRTSDNADEVAVAQDLHPKARRPPTPALLWALGHSRTGHCGCGQPVYVCLPGFPCPHPPRPRQAPWPLTCPLLTAVSSLAPAPASSPHPIPPHPRLAAGGWHDHLLRAGRAGRLHVHADAGGGRAPRRWVFASVGCRAQCCCGVCVCCVWRSLSVGVPVLGGNRQLPAHPGLPQRIAQRCVRS